MKIYIASDHAGYIKKGELAVRLSKDNSVIDLGPEMLNPNDDYPLFAERVANAVANDSESLGILVCRSGQGMEIAANKVDGVRAALVWNEHLAEETRRDNDSNVLSLPSGELDINQMYEISKKFISTQFSGEVRHKRRIEEIKNIEDNNG